MNNEIQQAIQILSILKYDNDKGSGVRLSFILIDNPQKSKNFVGRPVIDQFYDDKDLFDKISDIDLEAPILGTFVSKPQINNPLKVKSILCKLETDDDVIDLL